VRSTTRCSRLAFKRTILIDPALPDTVLCDGLRLRQVLLNLIGNAIKFSSGQKRAGRVLLEVTSIGCAGNQMQVEFRITDNGIGISEQSITRLFTGFTQADASTTRRFGGSGLGLVISRRLVELMGGELNLSSTPGNGCVVNVRLPVALLPDRVAIDDKTGTGIAGLSCIVVGHDERFVDGVAATLEHGGARAERAINLAAATEMTLTLPTGPWIWILHAEEGSVGFDELRILTQKLPNHDIRLIDIRAESEREERANGIGMVHIEGNVLTRDRLFRAVAIAAGRQHEEPQIPIRRHNNRASNLPSRDEARRIGNLILVAEDNEINQKVIVYQLNLLGFVADVASTGIEALALWEGGEYALLLTDLNMPEMDGYELAAAIRSREQGANRLPILALTANAQDDETDRCKVIGMDGRLIKPMKLADLVTALNRWMPGAASMPESSYETLPNERNGEVMDISILETYIGSEPEKIHFFLSRFRTNLTNSSLELNAACVDGKTELVRERAHRLKSSAGYVGALKLSSLCAEMEIAGKAGNGAGLNELLPIFNVECDAVATFLDQWLEVNEPEGNDT